MSEPTQLSSEHGLDGAVPVLLPPPERRIATAADVIEAKDEMRREMKLWLLAGGALGQGLAAVLAVLVAGRGPTDSAKTVLALFTSLL